VGGLKELGIDANALISELDKSVGGLNGESLIQLLAILDIPSSETLPALMLRALINGNKELAKVLTLLVAIYSPYKLLKRLYLEVYKECKERCDLGKEEFRHVLARFFFFHV